MKIYVTTDAHYGLKSAGLDRTEEIHTIMMRIVNDAIDNNADFFVHMGDLGHVANPSSLVHRYWVEVFNELEAAKIHSRFLLGNHDLTNRATNLHGSLAPLERLGLKYVKCVSAVQLELVPNEDWAFLYLPYMSRSALREDRNQHYRRMCRDLTKAADEEQRNLIVFTHLNIDGAKTEGDFLLRPVDAVMPRSLYQSERVKLILSGHIHGPQTVHKKEPRHEILGAPICTDFGDKKEKRYAIVTLNGTGCRTKFKPTNCTPLIELSYDLVGMLRPTLPIPDQVDGAGVKVRIRCTEDQAAMLDLPEFANELQQRAAFVRPIVPTILRDEVGKLDAAKIARPGMSDERMIENWIAHKKPPQAVRISELAIEALRGEQDENES